MEQKNSRNTIRRRFNFPKLKFILPLILTLTLSSCNKEKDPNYPESITIKASDATQKLKEISTQLKDFEQTYENFYSEATTEEQKITIQKIQELITKVEYEIRTMTGTMFIDEYKKKIAEINAILQEIESLLNLCTLKFGRTCYLINNNTFYLALAA